MKLTIIGCGDAFGSGGRLQTCFHVRTDQTQFLIDCGATSLIGMQRLQLDPNDVSNIFVSHLHGDHFSGLVWWLLHAEHVTRRTEPLTIVGPEGLENRLQVTAEALFPDALSGNKRFPVRFFEYDRSAPLDLGDVKVSVREVKHPCGAPPYALRFVIGDKVIGFSGDTEWVDPLIDIAADADLYITECFSFSQQICNHMSWATISEKLDRLTAKRILLTHMNSQMLACGAKIGDPRVMLAQDGLTIDL